MRTSGEGLFSIPRTSEGPLNQARDRDVGEPVRRSRLCDLPQASHLEQGPMA